MIVERIEAAERNVDARHAAKHAETAFRRMGQFEVMLVRRIVSG
jgi:hypothetical protein